MTDLTYQTKVLVIGAGLAGKEQLLLNHKTFGQNAGLKLMLSIIAVKFTTG